MLLVLSLSGMRGWQVASTTGVTQGSLFGILRCGGPQEGLMMCLGGFWLNLRMMVQIKAFTWVHSWYCLCQPGGLVIGPCGELSSIEIACSHRIEGNIF